MFGPLKISARLFKASNIQLAAKSFSAINSTRFYSTAKSIEIHFVDRDGDKKTTKANIGTNLLDVAIDNNIDLEGFG